MCCSQGLAGQLRGLGREAEAAGGEDEGGAGEAAGGHGDTFERLRMYDNVNMCIFFLKTDFASNLTFSRLASRCFLEFIIVSEFEARNNIDQWDQGCLIWR